MSWYESFLAAEKDRKKRRDHHLDWYTEEYAKLKKARRAAVGAPLRTLVFVRIV